MYTTYIYVMLCVHMYVDDGDQGNTSSHFNILAFLSDINNDINSLLLKNVIIAKSWAATFLQR